MTISRPAGAPRTSALPQEAKKKKEEKNSKPQAVLINIPEQEPGALCEGISGHVSTPRTRSQRNDRIVYAELPAEGR